MLTIDDREPRTRIQAVQQALPEATVRRMDAGDYELSNADGYVEAWEVKTIGSLQSAVIQAHSDGRSQLEAALSNLAAAYEHRRLVIIGAAWPDETGRMIHDRMTERQRQSAGWRYSTFVRILDSAADHGIPVVQLPSEYAFVLWLVARHKAFTQPHAPRPVKPGAVFAYRPEEVAPLRVLSAFPGIGPALARRWWQEAGTVRQAIIRGMNGARRDAVEAVLEAPYEAAWASHVSTDTVGRKPI